MITPFLDRKNFLHLYEQHSGLLGVKDSVAPTMPDENRKDTPIIVDGHGIDAGGRPRIQKYGDNNFRVNDKVYVSSGRALSGPYLVSGMPNARQYTLSTEDGIAIENGRVFGENELQWA
ncbi:hypothetical protein F5Y08DRAFT_317988 [Xylaria arbuscula]|nr:hypothetical protein F5Y08DRAFT_317988 [Xylaria arbuscula]